MNEKVGDELNAMREVQRDLRWRLDALQRRIDAFEENASKVPAGPVPKASKAPDFPPSLPLPVPAVLSPTGVPLPVASPRAERLLPMEPPEPALRQVAGEKPEVPASETFEMHFGRVWLVRIGIVVLLTGLVFLGNFAWQELVSRIGPAGKLFLLTLAGGLLSGLGYFLGRQRESLFGYGRVLIGGGLATLYYAAYASHFVRPLQVIENPLFGGAVLLVLAGGILWLSNRMRSQVIASVTVVLGFYTAAINPIEGFSLFSNLVLSILAIILLLRRRWVSVSFLSLIGCYAAFGFWRMHVGEFYAGTGFWTAFCFPVSYWLVFTVATFLGRGEVFGSAVRPVFLTLNNGACFALTAPLVAATHPDFLWIYALGYGVVLLALAGLAAKREGAEPGFDGSYLAQGLVLIFVGLLFKLSGYQIAFVFALQSGTLLMLSRIRHGQLLQVFAGLSALVAFGFAFAELMFDRPHAAMTAGGVALILTGVAWGYKRQLGWLDRCHWRSGAYVFLATLLGITALIQGTEGDLTRNLLLGIGLLTTVSVHRLRMPELVLGGQAFAMAAVIAWLADPSVEKAAIAPWAVTLVGILLLMHWWQRQAAFRLSPDWKLAWQSLYAGLAIGSTFAWAVDRFHSLVLVYAVAALAFLGYAALTRSVPLVVGSQIFSLAFLPAVLEAMRDREPWITPVAGLLVFALQSILLTKLERSSDAVQKLPLRWSNRALRGVSVLLGLFALMTYVPGLLRFPVLAAVAAGFLVLAIRRAWLEILVYSAVTFLVGAWQFMDRCWDGASVGIADFAGLAILLAAGQIGRRNLARLDRLPPWTFSVVAISSLAGLWLQVARQASEFSEGIWLTISWSLLAFSTMALGFALKDRIYRICGLAILSATIARIFLVDVWQFEAGFRILSFLVLGVILLALGFLYNRLADALRKWM